MAIQVLPDTLSLIMQKINEAGGNFLDQKRLVNDRILAEEDRKRQQQMQDMQMYINMLPFLQQQEQLPNEDGSPNIFQPPAEIQALFGRFTGGAPIGPSADMQIKNSQARIAQATEGNQITASNQGVRAGALDIEGKEIVNEAGRFSNETKPITEKQKYIQAEAGNYATSVLSDTLRPTDKNRQTIINEAHRAFMANAPETPFKRSVRREDFAGIVDQLILQEKTSEMEQARLRAYAAQVSQSGVPDYMRAMSEMRMTINNRLQDYQKDNNFMQVVPMLDKNDPEIMKNFPPEIIAQYREYVGLREQSTALMNVQADVMANRGVPSQQGLARLAKIFDMQTGGTGTVTPPPGASAPGGQTIYDDFVNALKTRPKVVQEAKIEAAVKGGLLTPAEVEIVRKMLKGGKND